MYIIFFVHLYFIANGLYPVVILFTTLYMYVINIILHVAIPSFISRFPFNQWGHSEQVERRFSLNQWCQQVDGRFSLNQGCQQVDGRFSLNQGCQQVDGRFSLNQGCHSKSISKRVHGHSKIIFRSEQVEGFRKTFCKNNCIFSFVSNFGLDFFTNFNFFHFYFLARWKHVMTLWVNASGRAVAFGMFAAF